VRDFSHGVAERLVQVAPDQFTAVMSKARRKGKIYLDWLRNTREATAIASYSTRARPGAPVALPIAWDELESLSGPLRESVREVPLRLQRRDPWQHFDASRRALSRTAIERVET
jgi:bifunctional non-homologous end joining protein LigD